MTHVQKYDTCQTRKNKNIVIWPIWGTELHIDPYWPRTKLINPFLAELYFLNFHPLKVETKHMQILMLEHPFYSQ